MPDPGPDPRIDKRQGGASVEDESGASPEEEKSQEKGVEDSFPASDPPASSGITGPEDDEAA
ncbi:MAG: hypothetical protein JO264_15080 [Acidisphaera sp.]|nr:hypothetical protein [Acidisphaera sp.]